MTDTGTYFDCDSHIVESLEKGTKSISRWKIEVPREPIVTMFSRFGDWFGIGAFLACLAAFLAGRFQGRLE